MGKHTVRGLLGLGDFSVVLLYFLPFQPTQRGCHGQKAYQEGLSWAKRVEVDDGLFDDGGSWSVSLVRCATVSELTTER